MALNTSVNRSFLISVFPDLAGDTNFKILSDRTQEYNCIAWAMGYDDRWVDPYLVPGHWWPMGVERNLATESLIKAFQSEGFELSDNDMEEDGYAKVVLYKKENINEWTHAARIVSDEVEYSKFGNAWDGHHSHNVLCKTSKGQESLSYGVAYAYMRKRVDILPSKNISGKMTVDLNNLAKLRAMLGK